ncbi:MAG TPA: glycosyl hydrolase [Solirubrobacteraceae bacterium]|nr:glycosyl hydrolase [Solirubrobacteraceae bacterium]
MSKVRWIRTRGHKRPAALALALCLLACFAQTAAGSQAHIAAVAPPLGGVDIDGLTSGSTPAQADQSIALASSLRAKIVRVELPWSVLEPSGPGQLDARALAYTDRLFADAAARDIRIIVMLDSSPCWATSAPESVQRSCVPGRRSEANGYPPSQPSDFAAFATTLVERYKGQIDALEVWNEPDQANEKYFAGPEKPQRYAALLRATYPLVKAADPAVNVLAGSLVGFNGVFLRLLYEAGIKGYYDGLAVHYYTLTLAAIRSIRAVQLANGDSKPLWLDEFGWSDCYPRLKVQEEQACVSAAVQAKNITNIYRSLSTTGYMQAITLYQLQDGDGDSFGVASAQGARKPAFSALASVLSSPIGPVSPVTLSLRRVGSGIVASGEGPVGDYMHMEIFKNGVLRYKVLFTLNSFNRYSFKLPRAIGTRAVRVRVFQQWSGSRRAAQRTI